MLIKDILLRQKSNDNLAVTFGKEKLTYRQLFEFVQKNADKLKIYASNSHNIGLLLPNSSNYIIGLFTILFLDKAAVPLEASIKKSELKNIINYCDINLIITDTKHKKLLTDVENINIFDIETNTLEINSQSCIKCDLQTHFDDVTMLMHTSGSSDKPKRVMLTNRNIISNIEANIEALNIKENDKTLISLPMYFSYCNTAQLLSHMYVGAQIVILDTIFLPHIFFSIVEKEKITNFMTVPTIIKTLLNYSNQKTIQSLKWISIGGAPIDNETFKKLIESFKDIEFIKTYGLTEASPRVSTLLSKDCRTKTASIGKPMKGIEVKIILENGNEAKEYEKGELSLKGDNVMKGYYKNTQETAKTIKDGWLHTGDIGYYDEEGFIYLSGRKKNIIISNGINIYPEEIEDVLMSHHAVEQAYVYGILNETYGEIPEAKIVIKKETAISDMELLQYCREKLSDYKIPAKIIFVDKLQYTNNMKIKRTESLNVK